MLKLALIITLGLSTFKSYCYINDFKDETKELIKTALKFEDPNPIHRPVAEEVYSEFVKLLNSWGDSLDPLQIDPNKYFDLLIRNASQYYDDGIDERRMKYRRSMCFASLALIFDFEKGITFLEYAKFSLIGSIDTPNIDLLEDKILGLMLLELLIISKEPLQGLDRVIEDIEHFVEVNKSRINESLVNSTLELLRNR